MTIFVSLASPWLWRILRVAAFPLWSLRTGAVWLISAEMLQRSSNQTAIGVKSSDYWHLRRARGEVFAYHAVRGYWLVRLLEETHSGFLTGLFTACFNARDIEQRIAEQLGFARERWWVDVDSEIVDHFRKSLQSKPGVIQSATTASAFTE
jgi:hypothetical protein